MPDNLAPAVRGQKLLLDPGSEAAEAYRALRTAIKFGVPEGRAKTILIASPSSGDGKTTVASNLFSMEWPPRSGKIGEFPEVDRAAWFSIAQARLQILKGQAPFLDRLLALVNPA